jgi:hypothetical protein
MEFFRYVWRIATVAFSHSLSIAQDVIFATVIALGFIVYLAPGPHMGIDFGQWSLAMSAWQIAAIVAAIIFGLRLILAPYWIYQEQQATIVAQRTQLESQTTHQNTQHRAIEIEFQPIEPFLRKRTFPAGNSRFEAYVKIKNCGNGFISELVISIVEISPQPADNIYTILTPQDRLSRGEFKYVLVAGFNELPLNDGQALYNDLVTFAFATGGYFRGFTTIKPPPPHAPTLITIEVTALECRIERKQFKLWVGVNRRLLMAEA